MPQDFSLNDEQFSAYTELHHTYAVDYEGLDYLEPEQMTELLARIKAIREEKNQ